MRISDGLRDGMLLQRDARSGAARPRAGGTCAAAGPVLARVNGGRPRRCGKAASGAWSAALPPLPAGGPYRIEFRVGRERRAVKNVYVGDLWILAGQSNMVGAGRYSAPEPPDPRVRVYDKAGLWRVAADPLDGAGRGKSTGLGVAFGKTLYGLTGIPQGLIPCARGASSMDDWRPDRRCADQETLYQAMRRRVAECGGRVRGILWYQGESDGTPERARRYAAAMKGLVARMRDDFGGDLPFLFVQIGRVLTFADDKNLADHTPDAWDRIRCRQEVLSRTMGNVEMTTAVDLELDNKIHHSCEALKTVGRRLALLAARRAYGQRGIRPGPRIASIRPCRDGTDACLDAAFRGVNGRLVAGGRPSGFRVFRRNGREVPVIKTRLRGPRLVRIYLHEPCARGTLWYGRGPDPYCNIGDEAGLALPAFCRAF